MAQIKDGEALLKYIESAISQLDVRIESGEKVIDQCKKQMRNLKGTLKEYKRIKNQVVIANAADGDL